MSRFPELPRATATTLSRGPPSRSQLNRTQTSHARSPAADNSSTVAAPTAASTCACWTAALGGASRPAAPSSAAHTRASYWGACTSGRARRRRRASPLLPDPQGPAGPMRRVRGGARGVLSGPRVPEGGVWAEVPARREVLRGASVLG